MMNFWLFIPEFALTALAFSVIGIDLFLPKEKKIYLPWFSLFGLLGILAMSLAYLSGKEEILYGGLFLIDDFSIFFMGFFLILGVIVILISTEYVNKHLKHPGEYYGILIFSILAMILMSASGELLTAYISLELLSFGLYVLVAHGRYGEKSTEAGIKYILLGALASALLLYGISQIYGLLGTTKFSDIHLAFVTESVSSLDMGIVIGIAMIIAGLAFKIAAVPFHMWAPDVYEGAPTPITAYLAVGSKAAAFALMMRIFSNGFISIIDDWQMIIIVLAALTMTLGNLVAIAQSNMKRLLAYSSIGHVGYLLMGIVAMTPLAFDGIILHLIGYGLTNMACFLCVIMLYNATGRDDIEGYAGLADRSPFLAMSLSVALFSLAGFPFFAGFTTKFYLFTAVANEGLLWLVSLAILNSLISLYYYLMVIKQMYMVNPDDKTTLIFSRVNRYVLGGLVIAICLVGVYPGPLVELVQSASQSIFSYVP
jgi:NADH-quinone oxidoreductase subunit N